MASNLKIEDVFIQIRGKLQLDGVKLWLLPYYDESVGVCDEEIMNLSQTYSQCLNIPYDQCYAAISELQTNALEKLKQRDRFKESGIATFKIKHLNGGHLPKIIQKQASLTLLVGEFRKELARELNISNDKLKLICNGRVIHDTASLLDQGVKNGNQILALSLQETPSQVKEAESTLKDVENVKADTKLLANYIQLEDQAGNPIHIPLHERKSLMTAMALHEKGRTALKRQEYAKALVYFLDADAEFSRCTSKLLTSVDNYALLDLDIVWCYLCLRSVSHLPEAYDRLKRCEESFHKSYGPNLERLIALKGTSGNEAVLFMRLHLMQAIVLYHQNKRDESLQLLKKAEAELSELKVDDGSLMMLIELGYSPVEARIGLRATNGDVNSAANYINENREKRAEGRRKAVAERIMQKEKEKLGKCVDGQQYVNPDYVRMLVNMGFSRETARVALQQTNNIISDSVQYIQEHPQAGPSSSRSQEMLGFIEDLVPELEAAGFEYKMAKKALKKYMGDIMAAAEELLANGGVINGDFDDDEEASTKSDIELKKKKEDAYNRLKQDISMVDDDYLDLTLQEEEIFLKEYLSLLQSD